MAKGRLIGGRTEILHTLDIVHLNYVLMYGVVKIWLFPSEANLTGCDLLEGHLWRRWDIQSQFLH